MERGGLTSLHSLAQQGSAVSNEAQSLRQAASAVVDHVERSQALFGGKAAAISQIWALANECDRPDWDGEHSFPIEHATVFRAAAFIRALPDWVPLPEFAPESDGSISLDWIQSRNHLFSLSVGASNRLPYAWLDGTDKGHAVANFDGDAVPRKILEGIMGIMNRGNASIGSL
jgi:hypothetical protein